MASKAAKAILAISLALIVCGRAEAQTTARVSLGPGGVEPDIIASIYPAISADGRQVAFMSRATNLIAAGAAGYQVYARDRDPDGNGLLDESNGITTLMSIGTGGLPGNGSNGGFNGNFGVALSASGRHVMWASQSTNLVPGDTTGLPFYDVFVRDRDTDDDGIFDEPNQAVTIRVSVSPAGLEADHPDNGGDRLSISADGRYAAFSSSSSNLTAGVGTFGRADIYVRDVQLGVTELITLGIGGVAASSNSRMASISADARHVAFMSNASNLVAGDTNGRNDIFVYDRQTATTTRVSVSSAGAQGDRDSGTFVYANDTGPAISADGRFIAFVSRARNLVVNDNNFFQDVFVRDRDPDDNGIFDEGNGTTERISVDSNGNESGSLSSSASISADGRFVTFSSIEPFDPIDTNATGDIYMHDRQTGETVRVSLTDSGGLANGISRYSAISSDARFVAFDSCADNLVAGDNNGISDIFVRDRGAAPEPCPGDCNGDALRNITDLGLLLADFGGPGVCDTNGDGVVNITDLGALLAAFGQACP